MRTENDYEDTQTILAKVFPESDDGKTETYTKNDFFIKNKDKYISKDIEARANNSLRLPYLDSFLTRYVYYSFTRWFNRVNLFLGNRTE